LTGIGTDLDVKIGIEYAAFLCAPATGVGAGAAREGHHHAPSRDHLGRQVTKGRAIGDCLGKLGIGRLASRRLLETVMKRLVARIGTLAARVATRLFHSGMSGIVTARLLLAGL
jgi:hypothetical protein